MKCQICNKETDNWSRNPKTGEYESICNTCKRIIRTTTYYYTDFEEDVINAIDDEESLLTLLEEN